MNRALFLDRDGVVNVDKGFVFRPEDLEFMPGVIDLIKHANESCFVFLVTNQSGIARGYFSEEDFWAFSGEMLNRLEVFGAKIDDIFFAPSHPQAVIKRYKQHSVLRKPFPGMLFEAALKHNIDLNRSVLVGDRKSDIEAAYRARLKSAYLLTSEPTSLERFDIDLEIQPSLAKSVNWFDRHILED